MAKRFTDTEIWDKEWFMSLTPKEKCLIKFIFDKCDVAGIWSPNWILASAYIGEKVTATELEIFKDRLEFIGNKIFVKDFISFQYGTLSEACKPHIKIIAILKNYNLYERVCKGYPYPMQWVQEKDKDKEEEKDKESNVKIEAEKIGNIPFENFWVLYDKKVGDKAKLEKKWNSFTDQERQTAMHHIPKYKISQPDKIYRKDPSTFLNNKSWNDEIIFSKSEKVNGNSSSKSEGFNQLMESLGADLNFDMA